MSVQTISASLVACPGLYGDKGHISGCGGLRGAVIYRAPLLGWQALFGVAFRLP